MVTPIAAATSALNSIVNQGFTNGPKNINYQQVVYEGIVGGVTSAVLGKTIPSVSGKLDRLTGGLNNKLVQHTVNNQIIGTGIGAAFGAGSAYLEGEDVLSGAMNGAGMGFMTGTVSGLGASAGWYKSAVQNNLNPKTGNKNITIGLGIADDLRNHRESGALTWMDDQWINAGLTKQNSFDMFENRDIAKIGFLEAAKKADKIRFDVTSFDRNHPDKTGVTFFEFNTIINNKKLLNKTTFIKNGNNVRWNGSDFIKK